MAPRVPEGDRTVSSLGLSPAPGKHYELVGSDGSTSFGAIAQLELLFCRHTFRGQFSLIDGAWGILGRKVLTTVAVLFDGPTLAWYEHRPNAAAKRGRTEDDIHATPPSSSSSSSGQVDRTC